MKKLIGHYDECFSKLYNSLRKRFGLDCGESLEEIDRIFNDKEYVNYPVILVSNDDTFSKEFIESLNENTECMAFGYYREGLWSYNSVTDVKEMISKLLKSEDNSKKFFYISVDFRSKFSLSIPGTVCIKQGREGNCLYLDIIKTGRVITNEVIRKFNKDDSKSLRALIKMLYINRWRVRPDIFDKNSFFISDDIQKLCSSNNVSFNVYICVKNGKVVGFVSYNYEVDLESNSIVKDNVLVIKDIFVLEEYRRQGIATRLYEMVQSERVKYKCRKVRIKVWEDDYEMKMFVASLQSKILYTLLELGF